ncbi:LPD29 domain-containing protein [Streptomyces sp. NPDC058272]|uniref:LPD29 domain-containing protein n=1 Tax=Streptomyces sp. NPDC058272 TaxID=3346415 RepID=UPI0036EA5FB6
MDYIDTKDVAAELRNRLKSAFPGVKFSVRKGPRHRVAYLRATRFRGCTSDDYTTVRDLVNAAPYDRHGFLVGARTVTPHGLRYELSALSVCLGNLLCDLSAGRLTAADLEAGGISVTLLDATREALRTADSTAQA